ncbi:major facilitator superfamily domain-containing protein 10 [Tribolium castaneum]|uniref:Major facilitator superfamily domain-containing protein 10-like Protein n=1 Tax=Tribolium castaneum TaxID=7070 RepID=D6W8E6_TRICA|nr:PREDICTED: major facilitator superfamily domain-containing protein 10 [Tribolium castaneum]EFA10942.1 Major facilitator superfamily domain-containing protein 10-like Protein [Tribolium castaneum]|eukprot:XP_971242.2 PREDICTED: major facilitator superfamily domain-containing protein 10 [Tribolium castaneum]
MSQKVEKMSSTVYVVFLSLLLDLLAFTMILPLLPSLLEYYKSNDSTGLYAWLSRRIQFFQELVGAPEKYNSVLFGGFLGSMFSFLQFVVSPIVGGVSDVVGRKKVMVTCLIGISTSYVLWCLSSNLVLFILARFIGGISKGNVSLSMAIIADVSTMRTRGKGMAFVGIAFSLGFIVGPLIGALFAVWAKKKVGDWFIVPALFALLLSLADLIFFIFCFKETLPEEKRAKSVKTSLNSAKSFINWKDLFQFKAVTGLKSSDMFELRRLGRVYFVYLFIYSGLEFTLTFLTHHIFNYNSMQQGWMFFSIGVTMALMQGGYVRRISPQKIRPTAICGLWIIVPSFVCVGLAQGPLLLYFGLFLFAVSTAMVVPCIMTMASEHGKESQKGTVMGIFRSLGALARALGPIFASIAFWSVGSRITYLCGAFGLLWPVLTLTKKL